MFEYSVLDFFAGGGGCGAGYARTGAYVLGCDIKPQPKNPHHFIKADWRELLYLAQHFDLLHASPPCQAYTKACKQWRKEGYQYQDLIAEVREAFMKTGKPYIIESVPGAPLIDPIVLNGSKFGLLVHRPRFFECSFPVVQPHIPETRQSVKMGRPVSEGDIIQPVGHFSGVAYAQKQMEIDWLGQKELAQAIPPAYTEWLGYRFKEWAASNNRLQGTCYAQGNAADFTNSGDVQSE